MKNDKYDISFFLSDPSFINWVKNPSEPGENFWSRWLEDHPEAKDNFYAARAIVLGIDFGEPGDTGKRKKEVFDDILLGIPALSREKPGGSARGIFPSQTILLRAAAAVLFLFLTVTLFYKTGLLPGAEEGIPEVAFVTKHNPHGQKMSFYLPDNSRVVLNAGSSLSYPQQFSGNTREVSLTGEAYFDVQYDTTKRFIVRCGDIRTRVHGTAFNVKAYEGEEINIALERGSVSVTSASGPEASFLLSPGEKLTVKNNFGQSHISAFNFEEEFGWKEGILVFRDTDMEEFIRKTERWYDVNITTEGLDGKHWEISGSFRHKSLETVMESLEFTSGVSYTIRDKEVLIYENSEPDNN